MANIYAPLPDAYNAPQIIPIKPRLLNFFVIWFFDVKKRNNKTAGVKKKDRQKYIDHTS